MKLKKNLLLLTASIATILGYSKYIEPNMLMVKNINIQSSLKENQAKIVFFSDTHFGKNYTAEKAALLVEKINGQNPDIVIFGGDLMDSYYKDPPDLELLVSQISSIKSKYGNFSVYGNHDYGGGASRVYSDFMKASGFQLLENSSVYIDELNINIIGLDDYLLGQPEYDLSGFVKEDAYNVLISHEPDVVNFMNLENVDLTLAGHTHGGQVVLPYITKKILPPGGKIYLRGEYEIDDTILYVTSGIGTTQLPLRFLSSPEIAVLTVQ